MLLTGPFVPDAPTGILVFLQVSIELLGGVKTVFWPGGSSTRLAGISQ